VEGIMNLQLHNQHVIDYRLSEINQSRQFKSLEGKPLPLINTMRIQAQILENELGFTNYWMRAQGGAA
jgi:hypothetical protein